jgi:hypothetical protein
VCVTGSERGEQEQQQQVTGQAMREKTDDAGEHEKWRRQDKSIEIRL